MLIFCSRWFSPATQPTELCICKRRKQYVLKKHLEIFQQFVTVYELNMLETYLSFSQIKLIWLSSFCSFSHQVWCNDGYADRPLCHHVSAGQPVPALPLLHLPVPGQHVSGHRQPLAAPAQVHHHLSDATRLQIFCPVITCFSRVCNHNITRLH